MASQERWAQAVSYRFADNTDDAPEQADLDDVQTHWDNEFGPTLPTALANAGIADTPVNRAIVQMLAMMSPGTSPTALKRACKFFSAIDALP